MTWNTWDGKPWKAPKRRMKTIFELRVLAIRDIRCPVCEAAPGIRCTKPYAGGRIEMAVNETDPERVALAILKHGEER